MADRYDYRRDRYRGNNDDDDFEYGRGRFGARSDDEMRPYQQGRGGRRGPGMNEMDYDQPGYRSGGRYGQRGGRREMGDYDYGGESYFGTGRGYESSQGMSEYDYGQSDYRSGRGRRGMNAYEDYESDYRSGRGTGRRGEFGEMGYEGQPSGSFGRRREGTYGQRPGYARGFESGRYGRSGSAGDQYDFDYEEDWRSGMEQPERYPWEEFGPHTGRGPRNYQRSSERIVEDINERWTQHGWLDASGLEVSVENGVASLRGEVDDYSHKRMAEDTVMGISGVRDVRNEIGVRQRAQRSQENEENTRSKAKKQG